MVSTRIEDALIMSIAPKLLLECPGAVVAERGGYVGVAFAVGQSQGGVAPAGSRGCVYIGASIEQRADRSELLFMNGMHERGPVVDAAALVHIGAGLNQFGNAGGVAFAGGGDEGRNRRSGAASRGDETDEKSRSKLHK